MAPEDTNDSNVQPSADDALQPQAGTVNPQPGQQPLPQDGPPPTAPPDDVPANPIPADHPATDSGLDAQAVQDAGVTTASGVDAQTETPAAAPPSQPVQPPAPADGQEPTTPEPTVG